MKLRIRSVNGGETLRIDIPADSTLQSLKNAVAQTLNSLNSEIYLSLNKKIELEIPQQQHLQSFGIRGGDLLFYTLDPNYFTTNVSQNPNSQTSASNPSNTTLTQNACDSSRNDSPQNQRIKSTNECPSQTPNHQTLGQNPSRQTLRELCASAAMKRAFEGSSSNPWKSDEVTVKKKLEEEKKDEPQAMDMDEEFVENSWSIPYFFERVLAEEVENLKGVKELLILAVHAVMLEAGFLGFDVKNSEGLLGFRLPQGWAVKAGVSISYTLEELVIDGRHSKDVKNVELKFNDVGNYLVVYGIVASKMGSQNYRLCLESGKFLPPLEFHRESLGGNHKKGKENAIATKSSSMESQDFSTHESVLFELWRVVKDKLCMPVLIALCENTGLPLPPCLIMLPTDIKMKILEALPARDVMKMGCVCTEFRYLSANDELWKQKYVSERGPLTPDGSKPLGGLRWKDAFVKMERKRQLGRMRFEEGPLRLPPHRPFRRFRFPFASPGYGIGGDYDRFPGGIGDGRFGSGCLLGAVDGRRRPGYPFIRRSIIPHCDLNEYGIVARTDTDPEDPIFPDM